MMFEVLETSWGTLQESLDSALTLDDIIEAHNAYMNGILARAMLNDESLRVKDKVEEVPCPFSLFFFFFVMCSVLSNFCGPLSCQRLPRIDESVTPTHAE